MKKAQMIEYKKAAGGGGTQKEKAEKNFSCTVLHSNPIVTKCQDIENYKTTPTFLADESAEERAGILQYCGGLSRIESEKIVYGKPVPRTDALEYFADNGFQFATQTAAGYTLEKWKNPENRLDFEGVKKRQSEGYTTFLCMNPAFLVFDLDKKDGKDGVSEFLKICEIWPDLDYFPAYTRTKSGGYHLYFNTEGVLYTSNASIIGPGIDIKALHNSCTVAPGSVKNGKSYLFFGDLNDSPILPLCLRKLLKVHTFSPTYQPPKKRLVGKTIYSPDIQKKYDYLSGQGMTGNELLFELSQWAAREGQAAEAQTFISSLGYDLNNREVSQPCRGIL